LKGVNGGQIPADPASQFSLQHLAGIVPIHWKFVNWPVRVMEIMQALKTDGLGDADHSGLVKYYEKMSQVEVKR
jgi:2-hydroxy-3-oxopropionate reductase